MRKYFFYYFIIIRRDIIYFFQEDFFYRLVGFKKDKFEIITNNIDSYYKNITINKKNGTRTIQCITKGSELYLAQKKLCSRFLNTIPIADNVFGFVPGYSFKDFLLPHTHTAINEKRYYLRLDIKDFFGSIKKHHIEQVFEYYFKIDDNNETLKKFTDLVTLNNSLPQGAVTSPVISNIVFRSFDLRIQKYCKNLDIIYTRYADDLLFSSNSPKLHENFFIKMIAQIFGNKFVINSSKVKKSVFSISLNGFVVDSKVRISRSKKTEISELIFLFHKNGKPKSIDEFLGRLKNRKCKSDIKNLLINDDTFSKSELKLVHYLTGYRAFLIGWIPVNEKDKEYRKITKLIKEIENIINYILDLHSLNNG